MVNDEAFNAQLSDADPPPAINVANVVKGAGMSALHSSFTVAGQVITGGVVSSIMIVWIHCPVLPQESAIRYVRVIVLGQVPLSVCVIVNDEAFNAQLSDAVPPPAMKDASVEKAVGTSPLH